MIPPVLRLLALAPLMLGAQAFAETGPSVPVQGTRTFSDTEASKARFHLDFDKVDIIEVIRYIALWTGRNIIIPPQVSGKITIISPTAVSADEAYDALGAALEAEGLSLIRTGNSYKIALPEGIWTPTYCPADPCPFRLNEEHVTKVLRLRFTDAEQMKNVLNQFVGRDGKLDAYPPDTLIISDTAIEAVRVESLMRALDQPGSQVEVHLVPLKHAVAKELVATLTQIFPGTGDGRTPAGVGDHSRVLNVPGEPGNLLPLVVSKILADQRTNRVIVIADRASLAKVEQVIEQLDVE